MSLAVITINNPSTALDKKHQEGQIIQRALQIAASQIRSSGGVNSSGTMTDNGVTIGTWTYTAQGS